MKAKARIVALLVGALQLAFALPAGGEQITPDEIAERFIPRPPGVEKEMTFFFGPFYVGPGMDRNQAIVDLPVHGGFITAIAPNVRDAATGDEPSEMEMHIHHAHWFRVSDDPADEYYTLNLAWVFGTGEEETQGSLNERAAAEPSGPRYGIFIPERQPQTLIFMLHNKMATTRAVYIVLDVNFVYGSREAIAAAEGCPDLQPNESCSAAQDFHPVYGKLWGSTFDVPRQALGDGLYVHPRDVDAGDPELVLGRHYTAPYGGTAIVTAGHMHPNGREVVIANLGPEGSGCEADLDGDGFAGVTLLRSQKIDHEPLSWPASEDYQMGLSQPGWRAPVREGDRITQFGVYQNDLYASYGAMSYVGFYVDRLQAPEPRGEDGCTLENTRSVLVDDPLGDPLTGIVNHPWGELEPLCGVDGWPACDHEAEDRGPGLAVDTVLISGFAHWPGDYGFDGPLGAPPRVAQGSSLRFLNLDAAANVRHTVSSCNWPCNGEYAANYPQPNGQFDSGKLGNLDYIDGGLTGDDTVPVWSTPADLAPGPYSYYCRLHPWMRGAFEVV